MLQPLATVLGEDYVQEAPPLGHHKKVVELAGESTDTHRHEKVVERASEGADTHHHKKVVEQRTSKGTDTQGLHP